MKKVIFFLFYFLIISCSSGFKKGGYYFQENGETVFHKDYYGNDRKKIYFRFSEKFAYSKENFNAGKLKKEDSVFFNEIHLKPSRKMLFSYHSFGRNMVAILENHSFKNKENYKTKIAENGKSFLYQSSKNDSAMIIDNLYPFGRKYIRVIEKSKINPNIKPKSEAEKQEVFIFPEITKKKPF